MTNNCKLQSTIPICLGGPTAVPWPSQKLPDLFPLETELTSTQNKYVLFSSANNFAIIHSHTVNSVDCSGRSLSACYLDFDAQENSDHYVTVSVASNSSVNDENSNTVQFAISVDLEGEILSKYLSHSENSNNVQAARNLPPVPGRCWSTRSTPRSCAGSRTCGRSRCCSSPTASRRAPPRSAATP